MLEIIIKCLLEGLAVALASHVIAGKKLDIKEIVMLGVTAGVVFLVLELYAPAVVTGARQGAGFGLGYKMVNAPLVGGGDGSDLGAQTQYRVTDVDYTPKDEYEGVNDSSLFAKYPWTGDIDGEHDHTAHAGGAVTTPVSKPVTTDENVVNAALGRMRIRIQKSELSVKSPLTPQQRRNVEKRIYTFEKTPHGKKIITRIKNRINYISRVPKYRRTVINRIFVEIAPMNDVQMHKFLAAFYPPWPPLTPRQEKVEQRLNRLDRSPKARAIVDRVQHRFFRLYTSLLSKVENMDDERTIAFVNAYVSHLMRLTGHEVHTN